MTKTADKAPDSYRPERSPSTPARLDRQSEEEVRAVARINLGREPGDDAEPAPLSGFGPSA